jgi:hypothetical protein
MKTDIKKTDYWIKGKRRDGRERTDKEDPILDKSRG